MKKSEDIKNNQNFTYDDSDYETPELLYKVIDTRLPKDKAFTPHYKTRDENIEGSVGIFVYSASRPKKTFSNIIERTDKVQIEVTCYRGESGANKTSVYLKAFIRQCETGTTSPTKLIKVKSIRHLAGPSFVRRNQFGLDVYTVSMEIKYLYQSDL